ncbi:MAG: Stp1/IreP family PP2C-type Ser/Thr phosphatase [Proteobacteria bacterium]|nr:Stp1/IreP family PP2C-type Ser/Thr phosphatase [Pseudomonadota bacterium]
MAVTIQSRGNTHVGRVRSSNQDSYLCDDKRLLYVIADGMGGHAGGEIASSLAVLNIRNFVDSHLPELMKDEVKHPDSRIHLVLADAINHASEKIYERGLEEPVLKGMGTTATAVRLIDGVAYCGHVGDSRMYLIRCGYIYQITVDHSLVSEQIRAGLITKEEAEKHHLRNVITRSVGYQESEDVDTFCLPLEDGDLLLLCSDGLHGKVSDAQISDLCNTYRSLATDHLIAAANAAGGDDNISVILGDIKVTP